MGPENRSKYLKVIKHELKVREAHLAEVEQDRNSAPGPKESRHDHLKEDLAGDANVIAGVVHNIRTLRDLVSTAQPQTTIQEGAEFIAELWDDGEVLHSLYFPVKVSAEGLPSIITPASPLGRSIRGLKAGDVFVYQTSERAPYKAGLIKKVE